MPCSGCSALHGVNPNFFKKKSEMGIEIETETEIEIEIGNNTENGI